MTGSRPGARTEPSWHPLETTEPPGSGAAENYQKGWAAFKEYSHSTGSGNFSLFTAQEPDCGIGNFPQLFSGSGAACRIRKVGFQAVGAGPAGSAVQIPAVREAGQIGLTGRTDLGVEGVHPPGRSTLCLTLGEGQLNRFFRKIVEHGQEPDQDQHPGAAQDQESASDLKKTILRILFLAARPLPHSYPKY